jgi:hypothetical protein
MYPCSRVRGSRPWFSAHRAARAALGLLAAASLVAGCSDDGGGGSDGGIDARPGSDGGLDPDAATPGPGTPDAGPGAPDAGPGQPLDCADLPLCDDFEGAAGGTPPPAPWAVVSPNCSSNGTVTVDDQVAHSGNRSVRVTAGGTYCDHVFLAEDDVIETLGPVVYGRFFVRLDAALGDGHTTFMTMRDESEQRDLRMGGQSRILMWNRESDDATLPSLSPAGIALSRVLPVQEWSCIEFVVDGPNGTIQTWVDGTLVEGLIIDGTPTQDIDEQWLRKVDWAPDLSDFKLGWEAYGGQSNTLWFDDVALASQPIGCDG